jgi:ubiquinone/menaquinone biosynthesis C-methylase UbiE
LPRVFAGLAVYSEIFHYARLPSYWGTLARMRSALELRNGERLLDIGCGTGIGARLAGSLYVGVDTSLDYLRFGRRVWPDFSFVVMRAPQFAFVDGAFDRAVVINTLHHLDDESVDCLFGQVARVVRKRVVVVEPALEHANPLESFLLRHDRGLYIRARAAWRALLARHWEIDDEVVFHNRLHTISQILFTLGPKPRSNG